MRVVQVIILETVQHVSHQANNPFRALISLLLLSLLGLWGVRDFIISHRGLPEVADVVLYNFAGNEDNTLSGFLVVDEAVGVAILNEAKGGGQK
jgi:hypothetical protein